MLSALILDFDGLILDTEWPGYLAWQEAYSAHGFSFSEEVWAGYVGTAHHADPAAELQRLIRQQGETPPPLAEIHEQAGRVLNSLTEFNLERFLHLFETQSHREPTP